MSDVSSAASRSRRHPGTKPRRAARLASVLAVTVVGLATPAAAAPHAPGPLTSGATVAGMDVSGHQGTVNWNSAWRRGARFSYVKATEGTGFRSPTFSSQYEGALRVGMLRGAYHFGRPDLSGAAEQARFFVANGGGWSPDGHTLPGALDIEYNPYGPDDCYGLSPAAMSGWIAEFSDTYRALTGRFPAVYTTRHWWNTCTAANPDFAGNNPLWVARYGPRVGELPAGWGSHAIWQHDNRGTFPGDQNLFNGDMAALKRFATAAP
ncbi:lysozyme [Actinopolyspora lacussalsi subsp. righensis]|uniref:lysozyme n=1 Tax=Actinopolyspora righensis TaxID=995060 RepID=A0A1I7C418_9ACTN|nr:lysozyme [Actinopolyspora righensis]SFT94156.1 lysozyme [Actinopolyspora righensis]